MIANNVIEWVENYKIFTGVIINNELKWNNHVDFIVKKASKKLYSPRILCRAGVAQDNILKVFLSTVRPVLEYAVPVCPYCGLFIRCNKRALTLIYPITESYLKALQIANIARLKKRSDDVCVKYMDKIESMDHPLHFLLPRTLINQPEYNLRKDAGKFITCRTKRAENFFTFLYIN